MVSQLQREVSEIQDLISPSLPWLPEPMQDACRARPLDMGETECWWTAIDRQQQHKSQIHVQHLEEKYSQCMWLTAVHLLSPPG
jgi:hypothetical protein